MPPITENLRREGEFTRLPRAIVFDWDGVFAFAKQYVDRGKCLQQVLATATNIKDESQLTSVPGDRWRATIRQTAREQFPDDPSAGYDYAMQLAVQFLNTCFVELKKVYQQQGANVLAGWTPSALDYLAQSGGRVYICSGTIQEEISVEARLAGVASKIDDIWGYPVRKIDFLNRVAEELQCDPVYVCLVDDSVAETLSAQEKGFSAIWVKLPKVDCSVTSNENCIFQAGTLQTDSFIHAVRVCVSAKRIVQPKAWVQEFLGDSGVQLERVDTRRTDSLIWRAKREETNELFYFKVLQMSVQDAEQLGAMLAALRRRNLSVPTWITSSGRQCIPLNTELCVVLERALPGRPLAHPHPNDDVVNQCAGMLAKLHQGLCEVGPQPGSFRPAFSEGLDSIGRVADSLWHLLIYCYQYFTSSHSCPAAQFYAWVEQIWKRCIFTFGSSERSIDKTSRYLSAPMGTWRFQLLKYTLL